MLSEENDRSASGFNHQNNVSLELFKALVDARAAGERHFLRGFLGHKLCVLKAHLKACKSARDAYIRHALSDRASASGRLRIGASPWTPRRSLTITATWYRPCTVSVFTEFRARISMKYRTIDLTAWRVENQGLNLDLSPVSIQTQSLALASSQSWLPLL